MPVEKRTRTIKIYRLGPNYMSDMLQKIKDGRVKRYSKSTKENEKKQPGNDDRLRISTLQSVKKQIGNHSNHKLDGISVKRIAE